jgi:hypothetical protein
MSSEIQHLVFIQFKAQLRDSEIQAVKQAAYKLREIEQVQKLEFRENSSPENLSQGFSHCLLMSFQNEQARDVHYLPHPIHQDFVAFLVPLTQQIMVFDYLKET